MLSDLPPGQRVLLGPAPRFGLPRYVRRPVPPPQRPTLSIAGQIDRPFSLDQDQLAAVPQTTQRLDLHCVMTWSVLGRPWTGWRFTDLWTHLLQDRASPTPAELVFSGLDGYAVSIALGELLRGEAMLAQASGGRPLTGAQGAPYRLVVPHLYGYQHVKHVYRIDLVDRHRRSPYEPWIMHRLGRVAREERSGLGMARPLRLGYRAILRPTLRHYGVSDPRFG